MQIKSYNMSGHGELDSAGGAGRSTNGGGGSGGRIAIEITYQNKYGGNYNLQGGAAGSSSQASVYTGAAGTAYKFESSRGPQYRELKYNPMLNRTMVEPSHFMIVVNNSDHETTQPTVVTNGTDQVLYEYDEFQIEGYSYVQIHQPNENVVLRALIKELTGNKKGILVVQTHQRFTIDFVESTHTYFDAPCGFHVQAGGEVLLTTEVIIHGEMFELHGTLSGVEELYVEMDATFQAGSIAHTGTVPTVSWYDNIEDPDEYTYTSGLLTIPKLTVNYGGSFVVAYDSLVSRLEVPDLVVKAGGLLHAATAETKINSSLLVIEKTGQLIGSGGGDSAASGTGSGSSAQNSDGSGGGLGGQGGNSRYLISASHSFIQIFN